MQELEGYRNTWRWTGQLESLAQFPFLTFLRAVTFQSRSDRFEDEDVGFPLNADER